MEIQKILNKLNISYNFNKPFFYYIDLVQTTAEVETMHVKLFVINFSTLKLKFYLIVEFCKSFTFKTLHHPMLFKLCTHHDCKTVVEQLSNLPPCYLNFTEAVLLKLHFLYIDNIYLAI